MKEVWILFESGGIFGVFTSEDKAKEFKNIHGDPSKYEYRIQKYYIEK